MVSDLVSWQFAIRRRRRLHCPAAAAAAAPLDASYVFYQDAFFSNLFLTEPARIPGYFCSVAEHLIP